MRDPRILGWASASIDATLDPHAMPMVGCKKQVLEVHDVVELRDRAGVCLTEDSVSVHVHALTLARQGAIRTTWQPATLRRRKSVLLDRRTQERAARPPRTARPPHKSRRAALMPSFPARPAVRGAAAGAAAPLRGKVPIGCVPWCCVMCFLRSARIPK